MGYRGTHLDIYMDGGCLVGLDPLKRQKKG